MARAVSAFSARRPRLASQPSPASPALPVAQYIGKEFPSEIADFARAAPNAVLEISICRNRQRTFQRRAAGCHRRGNALRPSAPKRRNIGPWLTSIFGGRIAWSNGIKVLAGVTKSSISTAFSMIYSVSTRRPYIIFDTGSTRRIHQTGVSKPSARSGETFIPFSIRRRQRHIIRPVRNQFMPKRLLNFSVIHQKRARHSLNISRRNSREMSVRPRRAPSAKCSPNSDIAAIPSEAIRMPDTSGPSGSLNRATSSSPYGLKNHCAFSSVPRCTNASLLPPASISRRFFEIVSTASRQNVQPKCRKNTRNKGRSASSASVCPSCDLYAASKSASILLERKIAGASSVMVVATSVESSTRIFASWVPHPQLSEGAGLDST